LARAVVKTKKPHANLLAKSDYLLKKAQGSFCRVCHP